MVPASGSTEATLGVSILTHTVLDFAMEYSRLGLAVLPLHYPVRHQDGMTCSCGRANCNSPAKHPVGQLVPNGIKGGSTKPKMVEGWFRDSPWNIGIVTGADGHSFDLPVLRYRAMVNRVAAEGLQVRQYFHRFTEDAIDLCDVLGSYVPGVKVKLDEVSKILGLPGKPEGIDGSGVEAMVLAGQIGEVARYCESDVLNTYRVWLIYELFRGAITAEQLSWSEKQIREFVANRKTNNPHLCAAVGISDQSP
jgi:hypothetical protein